MAKRRRQRRSQLSRPNFYQNHELDIVIPVYGRPDMLRECLRSLSIAALDVNYQLFIVDDCSPDRDTLEPIYASVNSDTKVLYNQQNKGFPATANRGGEAGRSPAILFLNTDVTLNSGSVRTMLNTLWSDSPKGPISPGEGAKNGVVGPKLLFPETGDIPLQWRGKVQHAGLAINGQGVPFHVQKGWSADNPRLNEARAMQAVTGACLMTRRETWEAVKKPYRKAGDPTTGGFNDVYGLGTYEDVEYCFAARGEGYRVVYEPKAVGYHFTGASVASHKQGGYPIGRNHSIFMARCGHMLFWDEWLFW